MFDAHTHLDCPDCDADRAEVLHRSREAGISGWIIAGTEPSRWRRTADVAHEIGALFCLGVHPWRVAQPYIGTDDQVFSQISELTPDGVGETGLDFATARDDAGRELQNRWFRAHLSYARERSLPMVIHAVRCYPQLLKTLRTEGIPYGGMIHSWSGPPELIVEFVSMGLSISFSERSVLGGSQKIRASLRATPLQQLLLETDCPNYTHGIRTEPVNLLPAIQAVAAIKLITREVLCEQLTHNVMRIWLPQRALTPPQRNDEERRPALA